MSVRPRFIVAFYLTLSYWVLVEISRIVNTGVL